MTEPDVLEYLERQRARKADAAARKAAAEAKSAAAREARRVSRLAKHARLCVRTERAA